MIKSDAQHSTLIEESVAEMWKAFEQGHEKLLVAVLNKVKGKIQVTE